MTQPKLKQQTHVIVITSQNINYTKCRDIKEIKGFLFKKLTFQENKFQPLLPLQQQLTTFSHIVPN